MYICKDKLQHMDSLCLLCLNKYNPGAENTMI